MYNMRFRGRLGFDVGYKPQGACRGCSSPRKSSCKLIDANDNIYAEDVAVAA